MTGALTKCEKQKQKTADGNGLQHVHVCSQEVFTCLLMSVATAK